jgi:hypothetical protein
MENQQLQLAESTVSLIESLKNEDVPELIIAENKITIKKALEATTIVKVKKQIGEKDLLKVVSFMLASCISNFNVTTKPSKEQAELQVYTMANDIINEFPYESLEDFALCFKKARNYAFGSTFNRVDSETVFGWMRKHLEANAAEREMINHNLKHPKQAKEEIKPLEFVDPKNKEHYDAVQNIAKQLRTGSYKSVKDVFPKAELPTHEAFINSMKGRIKMMSDQEMEDYLKQAINGKLREVIEIINAEKERRENE